MIRDAKSPPPNIVLILLDDLGWRDLGCYGSSFYETPNLDHLAREGMIFSDAYAAAPVCSPTRASLLTGKYPARLGITNYISWGGPSAPERGRVICPPFVQHLALEERSLAAAFHAGGYATWHIGKWHLGASPYYPEQHGFDVNIGGCEWGCPRTYFSPWGIPNLPEAEPGKYLTDHLTDEAVRLIRGRNRTRPFFLNLWHYAVHTPIQAPPELARKYEAKARRMGLDSRTALVPGEYMQCEHCRGLRVVRRIFQSDPNYAAMIENLDANIGRLLAVLDAEGLRDNTLVIFTSDNGGLSTAEGSPTCNRPLAEGKGWMYDGGTRIPLLARWPGVIPAGTTCTTPITSPDLYPTLLEAAGLEPLPAQHVDGISLLPLLRGEPAGEHLENRAIFWHFPHYANQGGSPGASVRLGAWKLIEFYENGLLELYNLREDIGENNNCAAAQPELVAHLRGLLDAWRRDMRAQRPTPNPEFVPCGPAPIQPEVEFEK